MKKKCWTIAYIDGQNLHLWTQANGWTVDLKKFRVYLKDKFNVQEVFYYLWFVSNSEQSLYSSLQKAWFIVVFREHSSALKWKKKWNVDVDIVFEVMRRLHDDKDFDDLILVSWDWDYIKLVKYLIKKDKFKKIIFPNSNHSSLYNEIGNKFFYYLDDVKNKIIYNKKRGS